MKHFCAAALLLLSGIAHADISNCTGVYVGMITVKKGGGLEGVTFLNSPTDSSGSYYQYFTNWSAEDAKAVLAVLTAAKLSAHRVNVTTEASDECSITSGWHTLKTVTLASS